MVELEPPAHGSGPLEVFLNVYDVAADRQSTVGRLNALVGPGGLGLGGVFHGALVIGTLEFAFGFCERGTGVYAVKAGHNPMYTFRESVPLGTTSKSLEEVRRVLADLKAEWQGASYDLLQRNCCHFVEDFAQRLGVGPVPGWLNRFATAGHATLTMTQDTVKTVQDITAEMGRLWQRTVAAASQQQQQLADRLALQQQSWRQAQQLAAAGGSEAAPVGRVASNLAGGAAVAGKQLLSGLALAGQQLRATTTRLRQAQAMRAPGPEQPAQQHEAAANGGPAPGLGTAAAPSSHHLLPGAQPKLSRPYRLHAHSGGSGAAAAGGLADGLQRGSSSDAFASLLGDSDDEDDDDELQAAACESALHQQHAPDGAVAASQ